MANYKIIVEDAFHIPFITQKLSNLVNQKDNGYSLLVHAEGPCIIRGIAQPLDGTYFEQFNHRKYNGYPEIKRSDGGQTWYHVNGSFCLNKHGPLPAKENLNNTNNWNDELIKLFSDLDILKLNAVKNNPDLYLDDGRQVLGTSISKNLLRTCFYQGNKQDIKEQLLPILISDSQIKDKDLFLDSFQTVPFDTTQKLENLLGFENVINSTDFIKGVDKTKILKRQKKNSGRITGPCISGESSYFPQK